MLKISFVSALLFISTLAFARDPKDINADGFADVVIGVPGYQNHDGAFLVFYGAKPGGTSHSQLIAGPAGRGLHLGAAAIQIADFNGDGFADVAVGVPYAGAVYIYNGTGKGLPATPTQILHDPSGGRANFGTALAAGDLRQVNFRDLVVGAPTAKNDHGQVYVYQANAGGLAAQPAWTLTGSRHSGFGAAVAIGDFNSDARPDLAVGAPFFNHDRGLVFIYGQSTQAPRGLPATPSLILHAPAKASGYFGWALTTADFAGVGYSDLAVGSPTANTEDGGISVFRGSATGLRSSPQWVFRGQHTEALGFALAHGDVNGDAYADLVAGGPYYKHRGGEVRVFHGSPTGLPAAPSRRLKAANGGEFGAALAVADFNGVGYGNLFSGAPLEGHGVVYEYLGGAQGLATLPAAKFDGVGPELGTALGH